MTEIDDLIKQGKEAQKRWRKPRQVDVKPPRAHSWREILENRESPKSQGHK